MDVELQKNLEKFQEEDNAVEDSQAEEIINQDMIQSVMKIIKELADPDNRAAIASTEKEADIITDVGELQVMNNNVSRIEELHDIPEDIRDIVSNEINAFRARSIQIEVNCAKSDEIKRREDAAKAEKVSHIRDTMEAEKEKGLQRDIISDRIREISSSVGVLFNKAESEDQKEDLKLTDEQLEEARVEKRKKALDESYKERNTKWLEYESARIPAILREMDFIKARPLKELKNKERQARRLSEYDDSLEAARNKEDYFRDHDSWRRHRITIKAREDLQDSKDRELEHEAIKKANAETESQHHNNISTNGSIPIAKDSDLEENKKDAGPLRLSFGGKKNEISNQKTKPGGVIFGGDDDDDDSANRKRVLMSFDDED